MAEPYYITTAISYPNGEPHIGHAYEAIAADVVARFQRAPGPRRPVPDRNRRAWPENGPGGARRRTSSRSNWRAKCRASSRRCATRLIFPMIASSAPPTPTITALSQAIWRRWRSRGDLYLDRYEGWYSVRDEAFYDDEEADRRGRRREALAAGHAGRMDRRGKLVLPPVGLSAALARPLCRASRLHPARQPPQRSAALRRGRAQRSERLAHQLRLGDQGPGQPRPRHVRVARRADQLSHRGRLSRRRRDCSSATGRPTAT